MSDKYANTDNNRASRKMLEAAGIKLTKFESGKTITLDFNAEKV